MKPLPKHGPSFFVCQSRRSFFLLVESVRGIRWGQAALAFGLAVALWYGVTVRDKVETWVDLNVQFRNAPPNLVISEGLINKIAVRVRAAQGLSRSLTGRDTDMVVNLSGITRGSNAIAITRDMLPFSSAYEVVEVSPPRILVTADTVAAREITLQSTLDGKLAPDLFVKSLRLVPPRVSVSGAESMVAATSQVKIPVPLALDMLPGKITVSVAVPVPANVKVSPPQVSAEMEIGLRTRQVKLTRPVTLAPEQAKTAIKPPRVTIVAELPESQSKDQDILAEITAAVTVPHALPGESAKLPVIVALPKNAVLVSVTPAEVTATVGKDD